MHIPKKLEERVIIDNPYRKILEKDFLEKDGTSYTYLTIGGIGTKQATMIFPMTCNGDIVIIKEYRVGIEGLVYGFPVGIHDEGLSPLENAAKELKEETGYSAQKYILLGESIIEAYSDGMMQYIFAQGCISGKSNLELGENIETLVVSKEKFITMIQEGTINCPFSLACYTLASTQGLL